LNIANVINQTLNNKILVRNKYLEWEQHNTEASI